MCGVCSSVHVWRSGDVGAGTPYEMGYAHGALMNETAQQFYSTAWEYTLLQVVRCTICGVIVQ